MAYQHHRFPLAAYRLSLPAVFAVLLALALLRSTPVLGAGVVGSGTPESCTEAALDAALAGGGMVTFNCGGAAPIIVTSTKTISADTTIDGGGTLTLDGETGTNVLGVHTGAALYLRNLTVRGGPTFVENNGTLAVSNCMLSGNGGYAGGAINNRGTLTITDSTLSGDAAMSGGAVFNVGAMTVTRSTFAGNAAGFANSPHGGSGGDGGAISNCGTLTARANGDVGCKRCAMTRSMREIQTNP